MSGGLTADRRSVVPVILCGGAGTRLWPASRGDRPKQFLDLFDTGDSLFAATLSRVAALGLADRPLVICGAGQDGLVEAQRGSAPVTVLMEPVSRNTAPAIALAALSLDPDALMLVCPSDHRIDDAAAFGTAIDQAIPVAADGWLVTFGITPDRAETGYGYIRRGPCLADGVHRAEAFVEKPSAEVAAALVADGRHDWNAGLFLMRAGTLIDAMARHCPEVLDGVREALRAGGAIEPAAFAAVPSISIDYAVMERAERVAVVPVAMGWSDVGSWQVVRDLSRRDPDGNAAGTPHALIEASGCLVRSDGPRVSVLGLRDVAVIVDGDTVAVFPLSRAQDVRRLAEGQSASNTKGEAPRS